jgi:hypothetical protein
MKNHIVLFLAVVLMQSCASYNYTSGNTDKTVIIHSDNVSDFEVSFAHSNRKLISARSGNANTIIQDLKKENLTLNLTHPNYDTIQIQVGRTVRPKALAKDVTLGLFTLGIPVLVDLFNSDFYLVDSKTKDFKVNFDFKQSYMRSELDKIIKSKNPADFQDWIVKYPKSIHFQEALDKRDSLELYIALNKESELAIDDFIEKHPTSTYLKDARVIKEEMVAARGLFEKSKIENSVSAYEKFLATYPRSLHNSDAHRRLIDASEKEALSSVNSGKMESYVKSYLIPNTSYLSKPELDIKKSNISKALDAQIIKENVLKDTKKTYEYYSNLWKSYVRIKSEISSDYLNSLDQTRAYQSKICDLLFAQLKEVGSEVKQKEFITKINIDFPGLNEVDPTLNPIFTVLSNTKNGTGLLKLFNAGYLPYYFENMSERNALIGRSNYNYRGSEYQSLRGITYEEITFTNGIFNGVSKCFIGTQLDFSMNIAANFPKEISYYQGGKLVMTTTFLQDHSEYSFEFENGDNLTLKELDVRLAEGNSYLKSGNHDQAINILQSCLSHNYPTTLPQIKSIQKSLTSAKSQKIAYEKKQEELRLAAEEQRRIQREKEEEERRRRESEKARNAAADHVFVMCDSDGSPVTLSGQSFYLTFYSSGQVIMLCGSDLKRAINNGATKTGTWSFSGREIWFTWSDGKRSEDWTLDSYSGNFSSGNSILRDLGGF